MVSLATSPREAWGELRHFLQEILSLPEAMAVQELLGQPARVAAEVVLLGRQERVRTAAMLEPLRKVRAEAAALQEI